MAQEGWLCPICYTVNAPWVCACPNCGPKKKPLTMDQYRVAFPPIHVDSNTICGQKDDKGPL